MATSGRQPLFPAKFERRLVTTPTAPEASRPDGRGVVLKREPASPRSRPRELLPGLLLQRFLYVGQAFTQCQGFRMVRGHAARAENVLLERLDQLRGVRDESNRNDARLPGCPMLQRRQNGTKLVTESADFPPLFDGTPPLSFAWRVVHVVSHRDALRHRTVVGRRPSTLTPDPKVTCSRSIVRCTANASASSSDGKGTL